MRFKNICVTDTPYTLFLYLLYCKEEDLERTFYVLGENIPQEVCGELQNVYRFSSKMINQKTENLRRFGIFYKWFRLYHFKWIYLRWIRYTKIPMWRSGMSVFCIDHVDIASVIIGNHTYTLIEDSPRKFANYVDSELRKKYDKNYHAISGIEKKLAGPIHYRPFGANPLCKEILVTRIDDSCYLKGKKQILLDVNQLWKKSQTLKQDMILSLFGCTKNDLEVFKMYNIILFTQPLYHDVRNFTAQEQFQLYKRILSNYPQDNILIKIHPRDNLKYEKEFPCCKVIRKPIPAQLLDALDIKFAIAITIFSSAASNFSYPIQIDWYGTEVHPKILSTFGHIIPPPKARICRFK